MTAIVPRFLEALAYIYPSAILAGAPPSRDVVIINDGSGPTILTWKIPGPIPSDQEVADALSAIDANKAEAGNYAGMIRRRAAALTAAGKPIDALILLHSIGE